MTDEDREELIRAIIKNPDVEGVPHKRTVYDKDGVWYWVDETWFEYGPYDSRGKAMAAQNKYIEEVLGT